VTCIRQAVLCVIFTDAGTQGLGEAFYFGGPGKIVAETMQNGLLTSGCYDRPIARRRAAKFAGSDRLGQPAKELTV
jgi:hypothetical protein